MYEHRITHHVVPKQNPGLPRWIGYAALVTGVGIVGLGVWDHLRSRTPTAPTPSLPPKEGTGLPTGVGAPCADPVQYPGFAFDGSACVPTDQTPPGIYMLDDCADFVFVTGDTGPQATALDNAITIAAKGTGADPTTVITTFLRKQWPDCTWPPLPNASQRTVQMWIALSLIAGRMVIGKGGTVLGTTDPDVVDAVVAQRVRDLGFPDYDPDVVPELELPTIEVPEGPDEIPPPIVHGSVELPPDYGKPQKPGFGGPTGPQGGHPPACSTTPATGSSETSLPSADWMTQQQKDIPIFAPSGTKCHEYDVRFGLCMQVFGTFGELDAVFWNTKHGDEARLIAFGITDTNGNSLPDFDDFQMPLVWKRQYKCTVRYDGSKLSIKSNISSIDDDSVDPCPGESSTTAYHWPDGPYMVQYDTGGHRMQWNSQPQVTLHIVGKQLYARMRYTGLPYFEKKKSTYLVHGHHQDIGVANATKKTKYKVKAKAWALGKV